MLLGNVDPRTLTPKERAAFFAGVEEGMRRYAWWKDGLQYVGCGIRSLKTALEELGRERGAL